MFKYPHTNQNKGFSTIEVLATALVFSIAAVSIAGILARSLQLQRRAAITQKIQENAIFVLEYMAREIRVSKTSDSNSNCAATILNLNHPYNGDITYSLVNGAVVRNAFGIDANLSSNDIQFTRLLFCISGSALGDNSPTRITIVSTITSRSANPSVSINLQTTVNSRLINN